MTQNTLVRIINKTFSLMHLSYKIKNISDSKKKIMIPYDIEDDFLQLYYKCKKYTVSTIGSLYSHYKAIIFIVKNNIPGDIVECGVWKGGSMMLCALTLLSLGVNDRKLYLYDTYEGMSKPTQYDIRGFDDLKAVYEWDRMRKCGEKWHFEPLENVKKNVNSTQYPKENIFFIKGKVENTIPSVIPERIAFIKLDTDWYESTYHELGYLYPKLAKDGILMVDDYGYWKGSRKAVDQFMEENKIKIFLSRYDKTGRLAIKL